MHPQVGHPLNRLAYEASPYLQAHATNPVDWYPWGPEALEKARREDKPILLSIGYSACHWCHVMERESFEDEAIARLMNAHFVSIKVDREERPDLDQVYQLVVQLMGQGGGWPLTVFLTAEQKPFFAGTYFPPADKYGRPGFPRVLQALADAYRDRRGDLEAQSEEFTHGISRAVATSARTGTSEKEVLPTAVEEAVRRLDREFDDVHGGLGDAPKFPNTMLLELMLRHGVAAGDRASLERVAHALEAMRAGGIWDHLGGGFHRYSTDRSWLVPHFEKMLYDNALLLRLYADAWRVFSATGGKASPATSVERRPNVSEYRATVVDIARYLEREMRDAAGGFYATQDADSEGAEGKFFVWTLDQVRRVLADDPEGLALARAHFGIDEEGNFEHSGATVLARATAIESVARTLSLTDEAARAALERVRRALFEAREGRPKPRRDEKILASWNGLLIGALASAGAAFGDETLISLAKDAFSFLEKKLLVADDASGKPALRVLRFAKDGAAHGPGFLDDCGLVACAALDLYEATGEPAYVEVSARIVSGAVAHFADRGPPHEPGQGFFFVADDGERLVVRPKDPHDHAIPSGLSMIALAMLRLESLRGDDAALAREALESLGERAVAQSFAFGQVLNVIDRFVRGTTDIVLVGVRDDRTLRAMAQVAHAAPLLNRTIAWLDPTDPASMAACAALAEGKPIDRNARQAAAYVCHSQSCSLPVHDAEALRTLLSSLYDRLPS